MGQLSSPLRRVAALFQLLCQGLSASLSARMAGQGLVEYGLILVLIMVVCVVIVGSIGQTLNAVWYDKLLDGDSPFHP